jgi:hypothetical protein
VPSKYTAAPEAFPKSPVTVILLEVKTQFLKTGLNATPEL